MNHTQECAAERAAVMIAFSKGVKIERRKLGDHNHKWHESRSPSWSWDKYEYRVKEESTESSPRTRYIIRVNDNAEAVVEVEDFRVRFVGGPKLAREQVKQVADSARNMHFESLCAQAVRSAEARHNEERKQDRQQIGNLVALLSRIRGNIGLPSECADDLVEKTIAGLVARDKTRRENERARRDLQYYQEQVENLGKFIGHPGGTAEYVVSETVSLIERLRKAADSRSHEFPKVAELTVALGFSRNASLEEVASYTLETVNYQSKALDHKGKLIAEIDDLITRVTGMAYHSGGKEWLTCFAEDAEAKAKQPPQPPKTFAEDLGRLINRHSMELAGGNTPDFILASFLLQQLHTFGAAVDRRHAWYHPEGPENADRRNGTTEPRPAIPGNR